MDAALPRYEGPLFRTPDQNAEPLIHTKGSAETKTPKRNGATKLPKALTWTACQAVRLSLDGKQIEMRSFPFWALSLEAARLELVAMLKAKGSTEMPYTDIYQFGELNQVSGKMSKMKIQAGPKKINIETGKKS